jgi:hypothetical protein
MIKYHNLIICTEQNKSCISALYSSESAPESEHTRIDSEQTLNRLWSRLWTDYEQTLNRLWSRLWTDYEQTLNSLWSRLWTDSEQTLNRLSLWTDSEADSEQTQSLSRLRVGSRLRLWTDSEAHSEQTLTMTQTQTLNRILRRPLLWHAALKEQTDERFCQTKEDPFPMAHMGTMVWTWYERLKRRAKDTRRDRTALCSAGCWVQRGRGPP